MSGILVAIQDLLIWLLVRCSEIAGNYTAAIILFTLLTKVLLLPVSLWTHRSSLRMVALTPGLNRQKLAHYGDGEAVGEGTQALYKRAHYHPIAGTVPMILQLALLIGVIGAVRELLGDTQKACFLCIPPKWAG